MKKFLDEQNINYTGAVERRDLEELYENTKRKRDKTQENLERLKKTLTFGETMNDDLDEESTQGLSKKTNDAIQKLDIPKEQKEELREHVRKHN